MFLLFQGVFALGTPLQELIGAWIGTLQAWLQTWSVTAGWPPMLADFLIDGIIEGGGVVVSFFPIIALFFIFGFIAKEIVIGSARTRPCLDGELFSLSGWSAARASIVA